MKGAELLTPTAPGPLSLGHLRDATFCWFYADVVDGDGNGAVIIVASALPFLVTSPSAPAVSIAVYRDGRQLFYVLQEGAAGSFVHRTDGDIEEASVGGTTIKLTRRDGELSVDVAFDVRVDGASHASGTLSARGPMRRSAVDDAAPDARTVHGWSVQSGPARGRLEAVLDGVTTVVEGRAYCDRNVGQVPLPALGLDHWWWCRQSVGDVDRVAYALWPARPSGSGAAPAPIVLGLEVGPRGESRWRDDLAVRVRRRGTAFGHEVFDAVDVVGPDGAFLSIDRVALVERGPFYARGLLDHGVCEHVWPRSLDVGALMPFVRMRVAARDPARQSLFLPLFCGHRSSRLRRLATFTRARLTRATRSAP